VGLLAFPDLFLGSCCEPRPKKGMKNHRKSSTGVTVCVCLICTVLSIWADEKLPVLKVGAQVYSNVTVTGVTATDVYFSFNKGAANIKLKNLDPEMQKHFHYDATKAEAVMAKQKLNAASTSLLGDPMKEPVVDRSNAKSVMDDALARVTAIVNQPVKTLTRTPDMVVSVYSPGWFHDGAMKPEFGTVDVRASQDTHYSKDTYVSSDLNPGVAFLGAEIEFNPMTKYFYSDRSLPKKKLSEAEMLEINRLYGIIAKCEEKMLPPTVVAGEFVVMNKNKMILATVGLLVLLVPIRLMMSRREA
jgi:hypothetical protein